MTVRRAARYVEALIEGRRPPRFRADAEEAELIRTAISLRAARGDESAPTEEFMSDLFDELAEMQEKAAARPTVVPMRSRRRAVMTAAAAAALIAGTASVTVAVDHTARVPAAAARHHSTGLRSVSLVDAAARQVGEVNLYDGHPSWVFMNLVGQNLAGTVTCQLRNSDGSVVLSGSFELIGGQGVWARTVPSDTSSVTSAQIVAPNGAILATAMFAPE